MMLWLVLGALILVFGAIVLRGAPYVPTHHHTIRKALDMLPLDAGDTIVDLGSGDGSVLLFAARRGYKAIGYELNPLLYFVAWLRCWRHRRRVKMYLHDYWIATYPPQTKAVFVFLAGPYLHKLKRKLDIEMTKRSEPLWVISNGFALPGVLPRQISNGLYMYELKPERTREQATV